MMLVLLAVLLLVSQLGEVVGLPPNYEDIDMSVDQAKGEKVCHFSINLQIVLISVMPPFCIWYVSRYRFSINAPLILIAREIILVLVGFGRACAPVRCAHPSFWA
jgi:hypothetical protein